MNNTNPLTTAAALLLAAAATAFAAEPDIFIVDFTSDPLPEGWQVEGYAFGTRAPGPDRQQAAVTTPNQRQYQFGTLTSPEFTIERDYLVMKLGGTRHPEKCCVALVIDGQDARRISPGESRQALSSMDVREFIGNKAKLQIRDRHFNGWVELGHIVQSNKPKGLAQDKIPSWKPAVFETKINGPVLLLPIGDKNAPIQTVTIEIDGEKKLMADLPLAIGETDALLPAYDLTGFQGKTLRVRYHETTGSLTAGLIQLAPVPPHEPSDSAPAFHVHCRFGKLNDPNGLVYHDGQYHLFHQYALGVRGKHWAHYVSTDLVHWKEQAVGLFPDETGSMHSGSGAIDWHNTGGFQKGTTPTFIAAFTGSRGLGGPDKIQVQGIAYSTDGMRTFTKFQDNPVIGEEHIKTLKTDQSRDPKIFWFSPTRGMDPKAEDGHWVMILFEDDSHSLFTSADLKQWKKQGSIHGFHECPELFPLAVDGDPTNLLWVMYGANGEYHIGTFDGETFQPETTDKIRFNHGAHHYAAQTFSNTPGTPPRRIQVAWQRDQISFPVELTLQTTPLGLRLCALPVREIENLSAKSASLDGQKLKESDANPLAAFQSGLYDIELDARLGGAEHLEFTVRGKTLRYHVKSRKLSCDKHSVTLPPSDPGEPHSLKLRIIADNCSVDVFAGDSGLFYLPMYFGPLKSKTLDLNVTGGPVSFDRLRVHQLKSIYMPAE